MERIHDEFDHERWRDVFALSSLREEARRFVAERRVKLPGEYRNEADFEGHVRLMGPKSSQVVGPDAAAVNLLLRDERGLRGELRGKQVPADVFVYGVGEPRHPAATKYGGRAYRRRDAPWPTNRLGRPLRFVGQLCFADSRDVVGKTPGDVLCLFHDGDERFNEGFRCEWNSIGPESAAVDPPAEGAWPFSTDRYYAERLRTYDLPRSYFQAEDAYTAIWEGTKVGGVPVPIQDGDSAGRFLGSFGSISYAAGAKWRFLNREAPFEEGDSPFMFGDMGSVHLFQTRRWFRERTVATMQCY
jgi:hypothetical protein